jgi:hypothetical protein
MNKLTQRPVSGYPSAIDLAVELSLEYGCECERKSPTCAWITYPAGSDWRDIEGRVVARMNERYQTDEVYQQNVRRDIHLSDLRKADGDHD